MTYYIRLNDIRYVTWNDMMTWHIIDMTYVSMLGMSTVVTCTTSLILYLQRIQINDILHDILCIIQADIPNVINTQTSVLMLGMSTVITCTKSFTLYLQRIQVNDILHDILAIAMIYHTSWHTWCYWYTNECLNAGNVHRSHVYKLVNTLSPTHTSQRHTPWHTRYHTRWHTWYNW